MSQIIRSVRDRDAQAIKKELTRLVDNAEELKDALIIEQVKFINEEKYFRANEMKVAIQIHGQYIYRLTRILEGFTAFDSDDSLLFEFDENKEGVR